MTSDNTKKPRKVDQSWREPARGPYTEDELREMKANGDSIGLILSRAYIKNKWGRAKVREILFGRDY